MKYILLLLFVFSIDANAYRDKYDCRILKIYIQDANCLGLEKGKSLSITPQKNMSFNRAAELLYTSITQYNTFKNPLNIASIYTSKNKYIEITGNPINIHTSDNENKNFEIFKKSLSKCEVKDWEPICKK